ncbi:MAG: type II secretion system protein [Candidatus Berkelbacteria bacterium]
MKKRTGFTLIEVLLSVATITVIAGFSVPLYLRSQNKNDLDVAAQSFEQALRRSQVLSISSQGDSSWGVRIDPGNITLYKGTTYVGRDATYDEITTFPTNMTLSAPTEIYFAKMTGVPNSTPSLTMTSVQNDSRTITINAKGVADF